MATTPIGITLPIKQGNQGYFEQSFDTLTQIKSNMRNFFITMKGERPFNVTFGTSLFNEIFSQNDDNLQTICETIIRDECSRYFPMINVGSIIIERTSNGEYIYNVSIRIYFNLKIINSSTFEFIDVTLTNPSVA